MRIIGVTGGSGSGKSTVANIIKEMGAFVIDADNVVRDMTSKETEYLSKIIELFGEEILDENKLLNRKALANIIFNNKDKKQQLDNLTSIYVVNEINKIIERNKDKELIVIDAVLLIESGLANKCDLVISVISDVNARLERICKRDGINIEKAAQRLEAQQKDDFYIKNSDYVVYNNQNQENLEDKINNIMAVLK